MASAEAGSPCGLSGRPHVLVAVAPPVAAIQSIGAFTAHLSTALRERGMDVCAAGPTSGPPARAEVNVSLGAGQTIELRMRLTDGGVSKQIDRSIDLASIPEDGRALALAASTDELLRAGWRALALAPSAPPQIAAVAPKPAPARSATVEVLLGAAMLASSGGERQGGGDLTLRLWAGPRYGFFARGGYRRSVEHEAPHGQVDGTTFDVGAGGLFAVIPPAKPLGFAVALGLDRAQVDFTANAVTPASAKHAAATAWLVSAGLEGWLALTPRFALALRVAAHRTLQAAVAKETMEPTGQEKSSAFSVTGLSGFGIEATLGIGVRL